MKKPKLTYPTAPTLDNLTLEVEEVINEKLNSWGWYSQTSNDKERQAIQNRATKGIIKRLKTI